MPYKDSVDLVIDQFNDIMRLPKYNPYNDRGDFIQSRDDIYDINITSSPGQQVVTFVVSDAPADFPVVGVVAYWGRATADNPNSVKGVVERVMWDADADWDSWVKEE